MKRDIKLNIGKLKEIVEKIKIYQNALTDIKDIEKQFTAVLGEYKSETIDAMKLEYEKLQKDMESCEEELKDLYTILGDYIIDMVYHLKPVNENLLMRAHRDDIYNKITKIRDVVCEPFEPHYFIKTGDSIPMFLSDEEREEWKAQMEGNYDQVEAFYKNRLRPLEERLEGYMADIQSIYDKEPFFKDPIEKSTGKYIESWYNRKRIHNAIDYLTLQQKADKKFKKYPNLSTFCVQSIDIDPPFKMQAFSCLQNLYFLIISRFSNQHFHYYQH